MKIGILAAMDDVVGRNVVKLGTLGEMSYRSGGPESSKGFRHLSIEGVRFGAEVLMWDSGEAEFNYGGSPDETTFEHHEVTQIEEVELLVERAINFVESHEMG